MMGKTVHRVLLSVALPCLGIIAIAQTYKPLDMNLAPYGFKGVPSKDVLKGLLAKPNCLFLDKDHVAIIAPVRESPKLSFRRKVQSFPIHYLGAIIDLEEGKVVSTIDLGGADYNSRSQVLSGGTLVFYRHGELDFWRFGSDNRLHLQRTVPVDVRDIDEALSRKEQLPEVNLSASSSHQTLYLSLGAPLSKVHHVWIITSSTVKPANPYLSPLYLPSTVESDEYLISPNWTDCRFYVAPAQKPRGPEEFYRQLQCHIKSIPSFVSSNVIAIIPGPNDVPQFRTDTGQVIKHPSVFHQDMVAADWDASAAIGVVFGFSGGMAALDLGAHINEATVTVFDRNWRQSCRITMKVRGADLSGPDISSSGEWITAYDNGHLYAWNVDQIAKE